MFFVVKIFLINKSINKEIRYATTKKGIKVRDLIFLIKEQEEGRGGDEEGKE